MRRTFALVLESGEVGGDDAKGCPRNSNLSARTPHEDTARDCNRDEESLAVFPAQLRL
jgi:hypothetical protein